MRIEWTGVLQWGDVVTDGGVSRGVNTLEGGLKCTGGMRLGVEPPLKVASPLPMGLAGVWGVGDLDAVALRVEALSGGPIW